MAEVLTPHCSAPRVIPYQRAYTTGQIARYLDCADKTVSKWCDKGLLPSYRLPGSEEGYPGDRRIWPDELAAFLARHLPNHRVAAAGCNLLFVGNHGPLRREVALLLCDSRADAIMANAGEDLEAVALAAVGRAVVDLNTVDKRVVRRVRDLCPKALVAVAEPDDGLAPEAVQRMGANLLLPQPVTPEGVAAWLLNRKPLQTAQALVAASSALTHGQGTVTVTVNPA